MYDKLSDKLLFEYFMIHSMRKENIYCKSPLYITKEEYNNFKDSSEALNSLIFRIMSNITTTFRDFQEYIPNFKYKELIINLKRPMSQIFWVRYDGFLRKNGGIFYSEFNYDKPCAEREILVTGDMEFRGNINAEYRSKLIESLRQLIKSQPFKESYNLALLTDPCHYEEAHEMCLMQEEMKADKLNFIRVGPKNLYVKEGKVFAFNKPIDVIIRLFPTEFSWEINDFDKILQIFEQGKVDIVNDPRVIIGQCKNLYTYLWKLVNNSDIRLTQKEKETIQKTLPFTEVFKPEYRSEYLKARENLVIKPIYGRYSIDVFIGTLHNDEEWQQTLNYVIGSGKKFIVQEFCAIRENDTYYSPEGSFLFPVKAFANIGCFMLRHEFSGCCVRWSEDYLTTDEYTWITPIGIKNKVFTIKEAKCSKRHRKELWNEVTERAMFENDFTGRYAKNFEYVGLDYISFGREKYEELKEASEAAARIMDKTQKLIFGNLEKFADILGIESLINIIKHRKTEEFVFLGRMDWVVDNSGQLRLLEINSETPAGLLESLFIDRIIGEELCLKEPSANIELKQKIISQFSKIAEDYSKHGPINTIGILTSMYYEDWYTAKALYTILSEALPYEFVIGSIYDCRVEENGKLSLYGKSLDAIYRYYPLDWFQKEGMDEKLEALKNTLSINPPYTIISQSKAFFAVIYELLKQGFYTPEERDVVLKYIPNTSFSAEQINSFDYIVKPLLSREGHGIAMACELKEIPDDNHVYQERVDIMNVDYKVYSNISCNNEALYPVFGTYITGTEYAGMYARLGKFVTGNLCVYTPVRIECTCNK